MWWQYLCVFFGAFIFDVVPVPLPPAFTVMILFQVMFGLSIWPVIVIGVAGSILGRYLLTLYIPYLSEKVLKHSKSEDVQFLGTQFAERGWKGQAIILLYTLLPLPTTPIFIAGGISRIRAIYLIPAFTLGKFTSDAISVHLGSYASESLEKVIEKGITWNSAIGLLIGSVLISGLLFVNWRVLIVKRKFLLSFHVWKKSKPVGDQATD